MKKQTSATGHIKASAEKVWETIAIGGEVHRWFGAVITACELRGSGSGAERICTMADGAELKERIIAIDHKAKRFCYAIDKHPLPATDMISTMEIADLGDGITKIDWRAEYSVADEHAGVVDQTLSSLYAQGIKAIETHCSAD